MIQFLPSRAIALTIGSLDVHWYGVMYAVAFVVGFWVLKKLLPYRSITLSTKQFDRLFFWLILGVLVGGRLGFVLFYGGSEYLANPLRIFAVWEGGMASHGGFIGVILALLLFCWREKISPFALGDVLVVPVALGLMFGRIGNLINGELYGTLTSLPWGMEFPGVEGLRHPTQIYAALKDLTIAGVCFFHLRVTQGTTYTGRTAAIFLLLYGMLRFAVEHFREQPYAGTELYGILLTRGQLLTIPIIALGLILFLFITYRHQKRVF